MHSRAVKCLQNLLTSHDIDPRYADVDCKARVASLYIPLVGILIDNLGKLYSWPMVHDDTAAPDLQRIVWPDSAKSENLNIILTAISDNVPNAKGK